MLILLKFYPCKIFFKVLKDAQYSIKFKYILDLKVIS